jgi:hypothetical protein
MKKGPRIAAAGLSVICHASDQAAGLASLLVDVDVPIFGNSLALCSRDFG